MWRYSVAKHVFTNVYRARVQLTLIEGCNTRPQIVKIVRVRDIALEQICTIVCEATSCDEFAFIGLSCIGNSKDLKPYASSYGWCSKHARSWLGVYLVSMGEQRGDSPLMSMQCYLAAAAHDDLGAKYIS